MLFCNRKIIFDHFCYRYFSACMLQNASFVFINTKSCSKIWLCLRNLLSNTIDIHWDYCVEKLFPYQGHNVEDYFEKVFLSQRLHLSKPDARIYEEVIRQAAIVPEESLFIDDLRENCVAAENLGIHTFQNVEFDDWLDLEL